MDIYGPPFNTPATSGWARHESENGFAIGEAAALAGKPSATRDDMSKSMPKSLLDGKNAEAFKDLKFEYYMMGYRGVKRYQLEQYSKKEADRTAASLGRTGFQSLGSEKGSGQVRAASSVLGVVHREGENEAAIWGL